MALFQRSVKALTDVFKNLFRNLKSSDKEWEEKYLSIDDSMILASITCAHGWRESIRPSLLPLAKTCAIEWSDQRSSPKWMATWALSLSPY